MRAEGTTLTGELRRLRRAQGLSQALLAERAGLSRQRLNGIESGRGWPSLGVALKLAEALGCPVEQLFRPRGPGPITAQLAGAGRAGAEVPRALPGRLKLGEVDGRWVAWPMPHRELGEAADALLSGRRTRRLGAAQVEPQRDLEALRQGLLVLGCDPALGLLAARQRAAAGPQVAWVEATSGEALAALRAGEAHLAGVHLFDEEEGRFNVPQVRRLFPGEPMLLVALTRWEQGFALAPGNPKGIRRPADLARRDVQLVNRPSGAGARRLLDRVLREGRVPPARVRGYLRELPGHREAAEAVALGAADVAVVPRTVALALGLAFVPLDEERFDLVVPRARAQEPRVARLLEALRGKGFRRELGALPGYDATCAGEVVAELGGGAG